MKAEKVISGHLMLARNEATLGYFVIIWFGDRKLLANLETKLLH